MSRFFSRFLTRLSCVRGIALYSALGATLGAAVYALVAYPPLAEALNNPVAMDGYDHLARGLIEHGTLSYFPDTHPTVTRGPVYPAFVAGLLSIKASLYPQSVQLAQAFLHGLTCLLTFGIASILGGRRRAVLATLVCAVYPYLLWYVPRVVVETLATFLFTAITATGLYLLRAPSVKRAALAGLALGLGSLCKQTLLPLALVIPGLLWLSDRRPLARRCALIVPVIALLVVLPWSMRNYAHSGRPVPVHVLAGYNFHVGNQFVEHYSESPLGYAGLIARMDEPTGSDGQPLPLRRLLNLPSSEAAAEDAALARKSLRRFVRNPGFLLRKLAINTWNFWILSSTPWATLVTALLQLPLLFIFGWANVRIVKRVGPFSPSALPLWMVTTYFLLHLPIFALARYSVVLIPSMIAVAAMRLPTHSSVEKEGPSNLLFTL